MDYDIKLDDKFGQLNLIDVGAEAAACTVAWFNQTLTTVNDSVIRMGVFQGEFHWHKHDVEDEFFFVLEGELLLDIEDRGTVVLKPHQGWFIAPGRRAGRWF